MNTWLSLVSVTLDGENKRFAIGNPIGIIIYKDTYAKFCGKAKSYKNVCFIRVLPFTFFLFIFRMKLLHQVSRVWRTDGLNSCIYKLVSVDYNPLYINITVDFWSAP